jgi:hypothetical protein
MIWRWGGRKTGLRETGQEATYIIKKRGEEKVEGGTGGRNDPNSVYTCE